MGISTRVLPATSGAGSPSIGPVREPTSCAAENKIVAANGVVVSGKGNSDEFFITGEPRPVVKKPGDPVRSGNTWLQVRNIRSASAAEAHVQHASAAVRRCSQD
jgi:hypothetical protein